MERINLIKNQLFSFDEKMWALKLVDKQQFPNATTLKDRVIVISGASRGIGLEMALRFARDGAKVAILAKSVTEDSRLGGTIFTAAEEINKAGGQGLPIKCDVRNEEDVIATVKQIETAYGKIDILINNASAISPTPIEATNMKRFDLMHQVNTRGTFVLTKESLRLLRKSDNPHILNISPPMEGLKPEWLAGGVAYGLAKYGMSLCVLGMSRELAPEGIAVNALWPKTYIDTAAVRNLLGGDESVQRSRKPSIMAEAAYVVVTSKAKEVTGRFLLDDEVLGSVGVTNLEKYAVNEKLRLTDLKPDGFL